MRAPLDVIIQQVSTVLETKAAFLNPIDMGFTRPVVLFSSGP